MSLQAAEAIISDIAVVVDQARWAYAHGYQKEGRGLDAARGVDLSRTEAERLAGPTYDLEIGSHQARIAYQNAATAITRCDRLLASALAAEGVRFQPKVVAVDPHMRPHQLVKVAAHAVWRASRITNPSPRLSRVRSSLDRAVRGLSKALDHGPADDIAHKEKPCRTCTIRPSADRKTECDTCATYRRRNGIARPTKLDTGPVNEARAAQQRRQERGEGWGVA